MVTTHFGGLWEYQRPLFDQLVIERYLVHVANTSLQPVGHRDVLCSLLSVGDCRTMVFCGWRKVFVVFSSHRPLMVADHSPTLADRPKYHQILLMSVTGQGLIGGRQLVGD